MRSRATEVPYITDNILPIDKNKGNSTQILLIEYKMILLFT